VTKRETRLKQYLISIYKTLGPNPTTCEVNKCDGCKFEANDALTTVKYALRREFRVEEKLLQN
jgi:hypothetical protein